MTFLTGCGKGRNLYNNVDLEKFVEICNYENIEIDTSSEEYIRLYVYYFYGDIYNYQLEDEKIKEVVTFDASEETVVELGDIVNIDFTGYKNDVAFDNGSATDTLLTIGSGIFIDDFEEQLIGAKAGQTLDVNVTFPEDYSSEELAGQDAKFVVTVNSVAKTPEQIYSLFNFETQDEYINVLNERAKKSYVFNYVVENSKIKDYPKKDVEKFYDASVEYYIDVYGVDVSEYGEEVVLNTYIYPDMSEHMVMYYIFDEQELELYESTVESQNVENPVIAEIYAVNEIVTEFLVDNAKVK